MAFSHSVVVGLWTQNYDNQKKELQSRIKKLETEKRDRSKGRGQNLGTEKGRIKDAVRTSWEGMIINHAYAREPQPRVQTDYRRNE